MSNDRKYTLITGASAGIGKAMAKECASRGQNLILVALQHPDLVQTASFLQQTYNIDVKVLELNLTVPTSIQYLYDWCHDQQLKIDVLINNAGVGTHGAFENAPLSDYINLIQLNNGAIVSLTHLFLHKLRENEQSYILNVGSFASMMPLPYKTVYSASKSFVLTFSRALQMELKPYNVHVSCLCPGPTTTQTMKKRNKDVKSGRGILSKTPEEVAERAINGLFKKEGVIIPGWKNRLMIRIGKILPFSLKSYFLKRIFEIDGEDDLDHEPAQIKPEPEKEIIESKPNSSSG